MDLIPCHSQRNTEVCAPSSRTKKLHSIVDWETAQFSTFLNNIGPLNALRRSYTPMNAFTLSRWQFHSNGIDWSHQHTVKVAYIIISQGTPRNKNTIFYWHQHQKDDCNCDQLRKGNTIRTRTGTPQFLNIKSVFANKPDNLRAHSYFRESPCLWQCDTLIVCWLQEK